MKIVNLLVENFRAIKRVAFSDLNDMIVVAGPNGCGKSCVLDSIRLFKSVYGGYQPNEWQQWFGEFQINFQRNPQQMASLLRDRSRPSVIEAEISLSREEIAFIKGNAQRMLESLAWKTVIPGLNDFWHARGAALAAELRAHKPAVDERVAAWTPEVLKRLDSGALSGRLEISPRGEATTHNNILLELVFSSFHPKHIGLVDYHGSHRDYGREELSGINLNLDQEEDRFRTSSLYNYGNKYSNIKSEMAADYVRQALREKRGLSGESGSETGLSETLQNLFKTFFPGKKFLGPVPTDDGNLNFPVEIEGGATHDINDLSSGEKEVLFGYLRLRNSAPKHSVILLDEPELHLNPALIRGLPRFYREHLALELNNQIWLVTHSDAFLREAVGDAGLHVLHMQYATVGDQIQNQVHEIGSGEEVEATILDLVGDLAAYRPGAKVVFFEGEDSEFDVKMVSRLFPEVAKKANLVSGGNKHRVETLHRTLEQSIQAGKIPVKIYSVVDKDFGSDPSLTESRHHHAWDVYHIENYLLHPRFICEALNYVGISKAEVKTPDLVEDRLKEIARAQIRQLVSHRVRTHANRALTEALELGVDPTTEDVATEMHRAVEKSVERVREKAATIVNVAALKERVDREQATLSESLTSGEWRRVFVGRKVLKRFAGDFANGVRYERFRDLVISLMAGAGHRPEGMKSVLERILDD